jgi:type I restriction enzyme S subunit
MGATAIVGRPLVTNQTFIGIVPRTGAYLSDFLYYLFHAAQAHLDSIGTGAIQTYLSRDDFRRLRIPRPPAAEQARIAGFLDRETAKIDALVAEQQRLIALLKEKSQAVVSHAVTRGLRPDVTLKRSGIEWLGDVPAHWEVSQLRHIVKPNTSITYGIVQAGPHIDGGIPYIRTSDMAGDELPVDGYARTSPEIDAGYARSRVCAGDIVVAIRATVGKCLLVPDGLSGANLTQGTAKISPGHRTSAKFLLAYMNSTPVQAYVESMAKGATFKEITLETLRRTPVLIPPQAEQRVIVDRIATLTRDFRALINEAEALQTTLQERRTALISAAVTGKIDVRALADADAEAA